MTPFRIALAIISFTLLISCNENSKEIKQSYDSINSNKVLDTLLDPEKISSIHKKTDSITNEIQKLTFEIKNDTAFVVMNKYGKNFVFDMKYATEDNFLKKAVYSCPDCLVRKEVAVALQSANDSLNKLGYKIKFFDCFRPLDVQKQMWKIVPDARYVANPAYGSIHNRGCAVDITLVDTKGIDLDMGTKFDHFGVEAHHDYTKLSDAILSNRKLLKDIMNTFGFSPQPTEWWHYNFRSKMKYGVSNYNVKCN